MLCVSLLLLLFIYYLLSAESKKMITELEVDAFLGGGG